MPYLTTSLASIVENSDIVESLSCVQLTQLQVGDYELSSGAFILINQLIPDIFSYFVKSFKSHTLIISGVGKVGSIGKAPLRVGGKVLQGGLQRQLWRSRRGAEDWHIPGPYTSL